MPLNQFRRRLGFGLKSRLPIGNFGVWSNSGAGRAFFIPNPEKLPLSIGSKRGVIQTWSVEETGGPHLRLADTAKWSAWGSRSSSL